LGIGGIPAARQEYRPVPSLYVTQTNNCKLSYVMLGRDPIIYEWKSMTGVEVLFLPRGWGGWAVVGGGTFLT
jgi:hypothetical protein